MKRRQVVPEGRARTPQAELQAPDLREAIVDAAPLDLDTVDIPRDRELWTSLEAAAYLRIHTLHAFYMWAGRHQVPREYVGKEARYRQRDLDEALRRDRRRVPATRRLLVAHTRRAS